jgi:GAF domain-containing protein
MNVKSHPARGTNVRSQMVKLLESGVLLRFDRTLDETLQHIVDAARVVIGAKYAALAVLGEDGQLSAVLSLWSQRGGCKEDRRTSEGQRGARSES